MEGLKTREEAPRSTAGSTLRVEIESVTPIVDGGRFPIKRTRGDTVVVEADAFSDGHDSLACILRFRSPTSDWSEAAMQPLPNDRWRAEFMVTETGRWRYTLRAFVDHFGSWQHLLRKRLDAKQDVSVELRVGAQLLREAAARAPGPSAQRLSRDAASLEDDSPVDRRVELALSTTLHDLVREFPDPDTVVDYDRELEVVVDRERARFSAWYELFPRSCASEPGRHGTLRDVEQRLPDIATLGFDVLYLPPIHPIGRKHRKGRNNAELAGENDVGSPWAIGASEGGHKAVHPQLGTLDDFDRLVERARACGVEIAMDLAFQCAPDHPYVREHPEWFRARPDGTIQYAENPPKKYQDIYPFDFECEASQALWEELRSVVQFWVDHGVRIFRVDNPHTKPFRFWEWLIDSIKRKNHDVLFLAEAFTRPKVMYRLAKLGFTQSYTYFAWRNEQYELRAYVQELTRSPVRDFFCPNFWPNTPDILTEALQFGGRPAFIARLVLAATLSSSYGIYGPAFELCEHEPREPGSEEYLNSEKYEIRQWNLKKAGHIRDFVQRVNEIRKENPALQSNDGLVFHRSDNEKIMCYSKTSTTGDNIVLVVVNLDFHHVQSGWVELPLDDFGIDSKVPFQVHDELSGARFLWHGTRNFVQLDPAKSPAHVFRVLRRVRREQDFEYYF